jgi:NADH-quinone oxidoreductase subunit N
MNLEIILSPQIFPPIYWTFIFSILLVIVDAFTKKESKLSYNICGIFLIFLIFQAFNTIFQSNSNANSELQYYSNFAREMLNFSKISTIFDIIFCTSGFLVIATTREYFAKIYENHKELYSLILFSIFGMMCIAHSNNLIVLLLGIEIMSISFYVLTGFIRNRESSVEGALKYFLLGAFATGFLVYGMAMIYGATGSMFYSEIQANILNLNVVPFYLKIGIGMLLIGILFKIATFPFHQWAPDVYQAAPSPITGFMSTAGKVAALAGLIGIISSLIPVDTLDISALELNQNIKLIIAVVAAATMLIGNITALSQKNIKRMLAYSSIGHAGYMLLGIVANNFDGLNGLIYYSIAYTFTQIGAFAIISVIEQKNETNLEISDYAGLSKKQPFLAATMAIFMFSLAGIPPFAGFFGKYFLFKAAIEAGFTWLTIIAVITSVISVYFYLSVIVQMYFKDTKANLELENDEINKKVATFKLGDSKYSIIISALGVVIFGIFPNLIINFILKLWE